MTRPVTAASWPTTALPTSSFSARSASRAVGRRGAYSVTVGGPPSRGRQGRRRAAPAPRRRQVRHRTGALRRPARAARSGRRPPRRRPAARPCAAGRGRSQPVPYAGAQRLGCVPAGAAAPVEPGPALDRLGGPHDHRQRLDDDGTQPPGPPQRQQQHRDAELHQPPADAAGHEVVERLLGRGGDVGRRREVPDQPRVGAEQAEGERGVALVVEPLVGQRRRRAEQRDRPAVDPALHQRRHAVPRVAEPRPAEVGVGDVVAQHAGVGRTRAAGRRQRAAGGAHPGAGRLDRDARDVAVRGGRGDQHEVGADRPHRLDLAVGEQVGVDDQQGVAGPRGRAPWRRSSSPGRR